MVGFGDRSRDAADEKFVDPIPSVGQMVESIVGCKWAPAIFAAIRGGVTRPGAIERECPGISSKVLHERLRKLERFGLVKRLVHETVPPHVEYRFTPQGERFLTILDAIEQVQRQFDEAD